jgi:hypothetical protein
LQASLNLVRELIVPNWDIHPEMITHTRVIDLNTGRPMEAINAGTMENSYPQQKKSVDELAAYLAYALRILKNCELPCEGITTPGGFGGAVKRELPLAVDQAVRDVYGVDLPHYFKYVISGDQSTEPKVVSSITGRFGDHTIWMKVSEIGRYWAAKELTEIIGSGSRWMLTAPFAAEKFTVQIDRVRGPVTIHHDQDRTTLDEVTDPATLESGKWIVSEQGVVACFDLPRGTSTIEVGTKS